MQESLQEAHRKMQMAERSALAAAKQRCGAEDFSADQAFFQNEQDAVITLVLSQFSVTVRVKHVFVV